MRREGGKKMKEGRGGEGEVYTINKLRSVSEMTTENTSE